MILEVENSAKLVIQHNYLINGHYTFTVNELRIFIGLLLNIKKGDQGFKPTRIECSSLHGYNSTTDYKLIKEAAMSLAKKTIKVETRDPGKNGKKSFKIVPLIAFCEYKSGEGYLVARLNDYAEPYLLNLTENFTASEFRQFMNIRSSYSYRIYWLFKQYEDFGKRKFMLADLRTMFHLTDKYPNFKDFRKRVLEPVKHDLANTDMAFEYTTSKEGKRSIQSILFTFSSRSSATKGKPSLAPPAVEQIEAPTQMSIGFNATRFSPEERLLMFYGFTKREIKAYKDRVGESSFKKTMYWYSTAQKENEYVKEHHAELEDLIRPESN